MRIVSRCLHGVGLLVLLILLLVGCASRGDNPVESDHRIERDSVAGSTDLTGEWPAYGGDPGGSRYSALSEINRGNIDRLRLAWTYRTGESASKFKTRNRPKLEATPLIVDGTLYFSTPLGRIIALDPDSGSELWVFDPEIDRFQSYGDFANRGVALWTDAAVPPRTVCRRRVFVATIDARLIAVDGVNGEPCEEFGDNGEIDLREGLRVPPFEYPAYQVTSPPAVLGDLVITGSAIADNSRIAPASGEVRAFDARTGELRWSWDPIPQLQSDSAYHSWEDGSAVRTGGANVWAAMVVDTERALVFLPTSSPAPDYFGGLRPGDNRCVTARRFRRSCRPPRAASCSYSTARPASRSFRWRSARCRGARFPGRRRRRPSPSPR